MVLYETMVIKRFIRLSIKNLIDKKIETSHQIVHNVLTDEEPEDIETILTF